MVCIFNKHPRRFWWSTDQASWESPPVNCMVATVPMPTWFSPCGQRGLGLNAEDLGWTGVPTVYLPKLQLGDGNWSQMLIHQLAVSEQGLGGIRSGQSGIWLCRLTIEKLLYSTLLSTLQKQQFCMVRPDNSSGISNLKLLWQSMCKYESWDMEFLVWGDMLCMFHQT